MYSSVFKDLKILDLSTVLAGPSVATFFAELGAQVTKVENPNHPDITRSWKLPEEDETSPVSAYFSSVNYGKTYKSIAYTTVQGQGKLAAQIKTSDIVLINFKPSLQEKLKLSDQAIRKLNPKVIIGKITGFGSESSRVAYDLILQAETGFMSMNGTVDSGPVKMPVALIDVLAAHHLKEGILVELLERSANRDYRGRTVSVSLYDAAVSSLVNQAANYLMAGHLPQRIGSLHPNIAPYGEIFQTKDEVPVTFAVGSNAHFRKLCAYLDLQELPMDERFKEVQSRVANRAELQKLMAPQVERFKSDELLTKMREENIPCGEIMDLKRVFSNPSAQKLILKETIDGITTKRVSSVAFETNS